MTKQIVKGGPEDVPLATEVILSREQTGAIALLAGPVKIIQTVSRFRHTYVAHEGRAYHVSKQGKLTRVELMP